LFVGIILRSVLFDLQLLVVVLLLYNFLSLCVILGSLGFLGSGLRGFVIGLALLGRRS
jgi:hypothetical protein